MEGLINFKLDRQEDQRDLYWRQRAHVQWMKEGNKNTKYFHSVATEKKKDKQNKKLRMEWQWRRRGP
jgi:hypothetical protein